MAEPQLIIYSFKEIAELMVKDRGLTEGYWGIYVKFGIKAANTGESASDIRPTALVPVLELGLQKFEELTNLSVDAGAGKSKAGSRRSVGATKKTPKKASKKK